MFLAAPLAWDHHLAYILPAASVAIARFVFAPRRSIWRAVATAAVLVMAWPVTVGRIGPLLHGIGTVALSIKMFAVLALWVTMASALSFHAKTGHMVSDR
jgi:hypothetical protein